MERLRHSGLLCVLAIVVMALFFGCEGDTGSTGPQGEQGDSGDTGPTGPQGEQGDPGIGGGATRTVMTGVVPIENTVHMVAIEGLSLLDPPLVSVFIDIAGVDEWDELPVPYNVNDNGTLTEVVSYASVVEGGVLLYNSAGFEYIMIIIE